MEAPSAVDSLLTDSLLNAAMGDAHVYHRLLAVAHLTAPPSTLFTDPKVLGPTMSELLGY